MPASTSSRTDSGPVPGFDLRDIFDNAPIGIFTSTPEGRYVSVNPALASMLGYESPEELIESVTDIATQVYADPADREEFMRLMEEHGEAVNHECRFRRRDGTEFWVSRNARAIRDQSECIVAYQGFNTDITERKKAEARASDKAGFLHSLLETVPIPVFHKDRDGRYRGFNRAFEEFFGKSREELVGKSVFDINPPDLAEIYHARDSELFENPGTQIYESKVENARGDVRDVIFHKASLADVQGVVTGLIGAVLDITARKQAEGKLKRIEWMLSRKPISNIEARTETHDQGYGDLTELNRDGMILKSIGYEHLKSLAGDYLELLETSSAIYEENGDYAFGIFASGWCRMMDSASRNLCDTPDNGEALNSGRWLCHESCWTDCSREAIAKRAPADIECHGGIRLYGVPIFAGGNVIGVINFGYGDPPKDPEKLRMLADTYHLDHEDLLREATAYDSRPPYMIEMAKNRLNTTAKLIGSMVETKQAMEALRENELRFGKMLAVVPDMISIHDRDMNILYSNWQGFAEVPPEKRIIHTKCHRTYRGLESICPDCRAKVVLETLVPFQEEALLPDGRWVDLRVIPFLGKDGQVEFFMQWMRDITERKRAEKDLMESEARFKALHNASFGGIAIHDKGVILECNRGLAEISGFDRDELIGMDGLLLIAEKSREAVMNNIRSGYEKPYEAFGVRRNGEEYPLRLEARNIPYKGKRVRVVEFRDTAEQKRAEEEHEKLREQFAQAQKLESVGRLAGGVAHDFNNMLGVIIGHAEMALDQVDPAQPLFADLEEIRKAAERSAILTRQLLTFARKQTVAPKVIDLNETVEGMLKMLRRLIGEDIDLFWKPGGNLAPVRMDPSQIDQILANLCVNARDAIAGVGRLVIETGMAAFDAAYCTARAGFAPGEYVLLAVGDNGCGMDKETIGHLFEPFFTTKEVGKGTGLGLATVYGAVKQNNGFIDVHSEPGQGTIFRIYLPRHRAGTPVRTDAATAKPAVCGSETILLVEDEPAILRMATMMLERLGYAAIAAKTPGEAIRLAREHTGPIDLLMTDVVMPEMNGRDLAENLLSAYPGIKSLFMSGYTADVIAHHGVLDEGVHFIQKPFLLKDLGAKLREVLDDRPISNGHPDSGS